MKHLIIALLAFSCLAWTSCQSRSPRYSPGFTADEVLGLLASSTAQLIDDYRRDHPGITAQSLVAFIGIENRSGHPIGSLGDSTFALVETKMVNSRLFDMVSQRQVFEAIRVAPFERVEALFRPGPRREFVKAVGEEGHRPDYLMWAIFTSMDDQNGIKNNNSRYLLTLEVIDSITGKIEYKKTAMTGTAKEK